MSIESTRKAICEKINNEVDTILAPVEKAKNSIKSQIAESQSELDDMTFSPAQDILDAKDQLASDVEDSIPDVEIEDLDEINSFIQNCLYLLDNELLKNPNALIKSMSKSAIDNVDSYVTDVATILPEYNVGQIIDSIKTKFLPSVSMPGGLGISAALQAADKIINCLSDRCGVDYADRVTELTDQITELYSDLNVISDPNNPNYGEFDIDTFYSDVGLTAQEITQMDTVVDSVKTVKEGTVQRLDSVNSALKIISF